MAFPRRSTRPRRRAPIRRRKFMRKAHRGRKQFKRLNNPSVARISRHGEVFPDKMFVKMDFEEDVQISLTGGVQITHVNLAHNSVWHMDPTLSKQPMYYADLSGLYGNYQVHGSSITVQPLGEVVSGTGQPVAVNEALELAVIPLSVDGYVAFGPLQIAQVGQYPNAKSIVIPQGSGYTANPPRLKSYIGVRKLEGISKAQAGADSYCAATGASPANLTQWGVYIGTLTGKNFNGAGANTFLCRIKTTHYVTWYNRNSPTFS